jgi:hypothetical protein
MPDLREGDHGPEVLTLKDALRRRGYPPLIKTTRSTRIWRRRSGSFSEAGICQTTESLPT